ncbi:hypothetical protein FRC01_009936 [Tulasnella sp. 417]|nr:hypothetical protein FRC01_009936 [Tulasnella sp. 417]
MSLLPKSSIRNLIVNRSMRPVCEQGLYQNISLPQHTYRSIRLLQTFLLRPDLALLVRHLEINFNFRIRFLQRRVPSPLQLDAVRAISLAKNIRSLSLLGHSDWMWEPGRDELRQVVSKMKLLRLELRILSDPSSGYHSAAGARSWKYPGRRDVDLGAEIRRVLQAQPSLEEFRLTNLVENIIPKIKASLQACLQASDIPSLKSLQATPELAVVLLPIARRLESLDLVLVAPNDRLVPEIKAAAIKLSIRRLTISIANYAHVFPSLREIEVRYEAVDDMAQGIPKVESQTVVDLKTACPLLEIVVDPEKGLWIFPVDLQSPRSWTPFFVGRVISAPQWPQEDLPAPK